MNAKIVSLAIMISVSSALLIDPSESASKAYSTSVSNGWQYFKQYQPPSYDTHAYPKYEFEYAVSDKITGDHKHQHETRDGNRVHGEYSLIEADGSLRRVQYNADHYNGFHAIIVIACAVMTACRAGLLHHGPAVSSHNIAHHEQNIQHELPAHYSAAVHSAPAVTASHSVHAAPSIYSGYGTEDHYVGEYAHPKYGYSYSVEDPHTGDHKSQHEERDGDVVKGEYSLLQPDGSFRKVTYTADHHNGFNAIVHNTPPVIHHH
ncbi:unnamed protein product, partial [Iphiclides podalirius]